MIFFTYCLQPPLAALLRRWNSTRYRIFVHAVRSVRWHAAAALSSAFFPPTTTCHKQPLAYSSLLPTTTAGLLCAAKRCQQQQHYCWINKDRQLATYRINNFVNARAALSFSSTMTVEQHTVPHFRARGSFRPLARSSCSIFCLLPTDHHLPQAATGLFLFPTNDYCWPPLRREAVPTTTLLLAKD